MNDQLDLDAEALADEIVRYLAVVDAFRDANCEPTWRPEPGSVVFKRPAPALAQVEKSTH